MSCSWCGSSRRTVPTYWCERTVLCPSCCVAGAHAFNATAWPGPGGRALARERALAERHPRRSDEILHDLGLTIARRTRAQLAQRRAAA